MKKVLTILLTLALCLSLFVVAAAEEDDPIVIGQVFWACTTPTSCPSGADAEILRRAGHRVHSH